MIKGDGWENRQPLVPGSFDVLRDEGNKKDEKNKLLLLPTHNTSLFLAYALISSFVFVHLRCPSPIISVSSITRTKRFAAGVTHRIIISSQQPESLTTMGRRHATPRHATPRHHSTTCCNSKIGLSLAKITSTVAERTDFGREFESR